MTKLIPLDAAIACLTETFKGIGEREIDTLDGWWETSSECDFGADRLNTAIVELHTLPAIDPAAIREAALKEALDAVSRAAWKHNGDDSYSAGLEDGARKQNEDDYEAILALIGEKK